MGKAIRLDEAGGVRCGNQIAPGRRGIEVTQQHCVAHEKQEGGDGISHKAEERIVVIEDGNGFLAESEELGAELVFELCAVVFAIYDEAIERICTVEQSMGNLDVFDLDGEGISGATEFFKRGVGREGQLGDRRSSAINRNIKPAKRRPDLIHQGDPPIFIGHVEIGIASGAAG